MRKLLFLIFLFACLVRFFYFPENIYFGYDQARDAFESQNIYRNSDLKVIGPSTAEENLFHGPLYWYLIGPLYLLGDGDPKFPAAMLLIINAAGLFVIFWIGRTLFNFKAGILAALLYAFSFEQTQYALYFGNPAPAVLTMMLFYGGLAILIFKKRWLGLPISLTGLGLSIQFEFFLVYLFAILLILLIFFRNSVIKVLNLKRVTISLSVLFITLTSFLFAEIKFDFRTMRSLLSIVTTIQPKEESNQALSLYFGKLLRHINDNLFSFDNFYHVQNATMIMFLVLACISFYILIKKKSEYQKILFLLVWIFSSSLLLIFGTSELYYTNIGISPALILLASFLIVQLFERFLALGLVLTLVILLSNIGLIMGQNPKGIISGIYVQEGMLLSNEKRVIDYIYSEAKGKPIVVSALTMPLKINTTWAYLFNWYGKEKYGYLPYWAGETALGYPGSLPFWKSQEESYIMFSIIEPTRGIRPAFIENFIEEQEQYGKVTDEKTFGEKPYAQLKVQKREN